MRTYLVLCLLIGGPTGAVAQPASQPRSTGSPAVSQQELNKALILRYYEEVWHKDNFAFADEVFAADYVRHDPGALVNEQRAQQPRQSELARQSKQYADTRFQFNVVFAEDDLVGVRWTTRVTPRGATKLIRTIVGKRGSYESTGVNIFRMRDGKVVEIWNNRDDFTNLREAGVFRWYGVGGFVVGVVTALVVSWLHRRWSTRGQRNDRATNELKRPLST